jgi:hypothetical protein
MPFYAAVLAGVIIAVQDIAPGQADLFVRNLHVMAQPDYGRCRRVSVNQMTVMLDLLGFSL